MPYLITAIVAKHIERYLRSRAINWRANRSWPTVEHGLSRMADLLSRLLWSTASSGKRNCQMRHHRCKNDQICCNCDARQLKFISFCMASRLNLPISIVLISCALRLCEHAVNVDASTSAMYEKTRPASRSIVFPKDKPKDKLASSDVNPEMKRTLSNGQQEQHPLSLKRKPTSLRKTAKWKGSVKQGPADVSRNVDIDEKASSRDPKRVVTSVWASSSDLTPQEDLHQSIPRKESPRESIKVSNHQRHSQVK